MFDVRRPPSGPGRPAFDTPPHPSALPPPARRLRHRHGHAAFTLLEVVLALSLAVGLLAVVLVFYQQIARLRDQTLADTAGLAAVRLGMDRLATELRTALPRPGTFRGGPQELEFVRCVPPSSAATALAGSSGTTFERYPLRRLRYRLAGSDTSTLTTDAAPAPGLERIEESAADTPAAAPLGSSAEPADPTAMSVATDPEDPLTVSTSSSASSASVRSLAPGLRAELRIPELRYLALRYWDGMAWQESWTGPGLPRGVEISLATEAVPANSAAGTLPLEVFRRVVALPTSSFDPATATNDPAGLFHPAPTEDQGL